jgi:pentatricopeptide repeat protein
MPKRCHLFMAFFLFPLLSSALQSQTAEEWAEIGGQALNNVKLDAAIRAFAQTMLLDTTKRGWAYFQIGLAHEVGQSYDSAATAFRNAYRNNYLPSQSRIRLAKMLLRTGRGDSAIAILGSLDSANTQDAQILVALGEYYEQSGDSQKARDRYGQALAISPASVIINLVRIDIKQNYIQGILNDLEYLPLVDFTHFDEFPAMLKVLGKSGKWKEAEAFLKDMIRKEFKPVEMQTYLVGLYREEEKIVRADEALPSDDQSKPELLAAVCDLARSYYRSKHVTECEELLKRVFEVDWKYGPARLELLRMYDEQEMTKEGIALVSLYEYKTRPSLISSEGILQSYRDTLIDGEWYLRAAKLYFKNRNTNRTQSFAKRAWDEYSDRMRREPDRREYPAALVTCSLLAGDLPAAEAQVQKCISRSLPGQLSNLSETLRGLIAQGIAIQDATYLMNKYLAGEKQQTQLTVASRPKLPHIRATVIGISQYQDNDLQLQHADSDATLFYDFLKTPAGGSVPDEDLKFLTNRSAQKAEVIRAVKEILRLAFENDEVIIYIACHGVPDERKNELYFMAYDSDPIVPATGIPLQDIQDAIAQTRSKNVLLIADVCHSATVALVPELGKQGLYGLKTNSLLQRISQKPNGIALITASSQNEVSSEETAGGSYGVFTYHLVKGLEGPADSNNDGLVTIREIYEYVYRMVEKDTGNKQHPGLSGTFDSELLLSIVK